MNNLIYKIYDKLPAIQSALTCDPYETPVHCCIYENRKRDLSKTDLMSKLPNANNSNNNYNKQKSKVRNDFGINTQSICGVKIVYLFFFAVISV